jgi:hypothetical protein
MGNCAVGVVVIGIAGGERRYPPPPGSEMRIGACQLGADSRLANTIQGTGVNRLTRPLSFHSLSFEVLPPAAARRCQEMHEPRDIPFLSR